MNFFRGLAFALLPSLLLWALIVGAVLWVRLDLLTAAIVLLCGGALLFHALVRITEP